MEEKKAIKKPTIARKKTPKQLIRWKRDFRDVFLTRHTGKVTNEELEYIADIMIEWVKHSPKEYTFKTFLNYQNTVLEIFYGWIKRSKKLSENYRLTLQILANNRERAALERYPEGAAFKHMQGTYDPQWKAQEQYFNQLRENVASKTSTTNFVPVIPTADEFERLNNALIKDQRRREDTTKEVPAKTVSDSDNKSA